MVGEDGFVPPALTNRPALNNFDVEVWNAFSKLSPRRPIGGFGAMSAIPYTEIVSYVDNVIRLRDTEDRDEFFELIDYLDGLFLTEAAEQAKKDQAKSKVKK